MPILITTAEQYQFGDAGVLLNGPSTLPFADINSVQGLDNGDVRESEFQRDGAHGSFIDAFYQSARTVTLEGTVYADPNNLESYLDSLKANFAPSATDQPLYFKTDSTTEPNRCVFGKSLGFSYTKDAARRIGSANFQVQIRCGDPRVYSQTVTTTSVSWGSGTATLNLSGNRNTPGTMTLIGPLTNPTITHNQTGAQFNFTMTLSSGQQVVIDLNKRTVLQGSTNVRNKMILGGTWPEFIPGSNTFSRGGSGSGTFQVSARSAWW